jgi:hypothetical protein
MLNEYPQQFIGYRRFGGRCFLHLPGLLDPEDVPPKYLYPCTRKLCDPENGGSIFL